MSAFLDSEIMVLLRFLFGMSSFFLFCDDDLNIYICSVLISTISFIRRGWLQLMAIFGTAG